MVYTLFNKVLGENEKWVFYFPLKTEGTFWSTQKVYTYFLCVNKGITFDTIKLQYSNLDLYQLNSNNI